MCMIIDCILGRLLDWPLVFGLAAYVLKQYMQGGKFEKKTDETGKVVIVTGSNTGIGKETVLELARRGATVYMACRDKKRAEEARLEIIKETKNQNIFFLELDLSSLESIRKFVAAFKGSKENKLHILINNAGVMRCPRMLTKDGFEMQLGVNHMGHFLLTMLLLDMLKKSAPSRIVNVSSRAHTRGEINIDDLNSEKSYHEGSAYSQSKLANVLFTRELARRLEGTGVTVNSLHPGVVATELGRHMKILNNLFGRLVLRTMLWPFLKTPKSGAQTTLYAALDPDLNGVTGLYFSDCKPIKVAPAATDDKMAKLLWEESEKWTRFSTTN
ncbi:retinol dehydrogenase 12-like isoform X3 [Drosophila innubila]|uniref:retinol dehydrogenase 12-like isoform X3 n=1 Tax=Drosophila innubila TaxID=198719 RepID=UPI00148CBA2F|nr:retinol dehydrogenase 12-like isoform X3 [Drosophila innubila]